MFNGSRALMTGGMIGAVVAGLALLLAYSMQKRWFPQPSALSPRKSLADEDREYSEIETRALQLFWILVPFVAWIWWRLFLALLPATGLWRDDDVVYLLPSRVAWLVPALFVGMLTANVLSGLILERSFPGQYSGYLVFQGRRLGLDAKRLTSIGYAVIGGASFLMLVLLSDFYVLISPSEIRIDPFWSLEERSFAYTDLHEIVSSKVTAARHGTYQIRCRYLLCFSDGTTWFSGWNPAGAPDSEMTRIMVDISTRSGIPIVEMPTSGNPRLCARSAR